MSVICTPYNLNGLGQLCIHVIYARRRLLLVSLLAMTVDTVMLKVLRSCNSTACSRHGYLCCITRVILASVLWDCVCKTVCQEWGTANTPMKICSSYKCKITQDQCSATLVLTEYIPHYSGLLCKTGCQQECVTAITPMKI